MALGDILAGFGNFLTGAAETAAPFIERYSAIQDELRKEKQKEIEEQKKDMQAAVDGIIKAAETREQVDALIQAMVASGRFDPNDPAFPDIVMSLQEIGDQAEEEAANKMQETQLKNGFTIFNNLIDDLGPVAARNATLKFLDSTAPGASAFFDEAVPADVAGKEQLSTDKRQELKDEGLRLLIDSRRANMARQGKADAAVDKNAADDANDRSLAAVALDLIKQDRYTPDAQRELLARTRTARGQSRLNTILESIPKPPEVNVSSKLEDVGPMGTTMNLSGKVPMSDVTAFQAMQEEERARALATRDPDDLTEEEIQFIESYSPKPPVPTTPGLEMLQGMSGMGGMELGMPDSTMGTPFGQFGVR